MSEIQLQVAIPIQWGLVTEVPQPSNAFVVQRTPADEIVLTFGHASPFTAGPPETQNEQDRELIAKGVPPEMVGRVILSMKTARDLHRILAEQLGI